MEGGAVEPVSDWPVHGLEDDIRPRMFAAAQRGEAFALATIVAADGGPRPVGAQMVVTTGDSWGFLSGGCIESDVAGHAREALRDGAPRWLVYGRDSPFIDIRLPCGGRIDVAVERVLPDDGALRQLFALTAARRAALWASDGTTRQAIAAPEAPGGAFPIMCRYAPVQRLMVIGADPFALAIAGLGQTLGWETRLLSSFGPDGPPPFGIVHDKRPLAVSLAETVLDPWTAIAVATHDRDRDEEALVPALRSAAGYVGVLGSRRKLDQRLARLAAAGLTPGETARLRAPIGIPLDARAPWEVAVSVVAEIIACRRSGTAQGHRPPPEAASSSG